MATSQTLLIKKFTGSFIRIQTLPEVTPKDNSKKIIYKEASQFLPNESLRSSSVSKKSS